MNNTTNEIQSFVGHATLPTTLPLEGALRDIPKDRCEGDYTLQLVKSKEQ